MARETILKVGLPVTCHACKTKDYIKVGTDRGGWYWYRGMSGKVRWYCPKEAEKVKQSRSNFEQRYSTPAPVETKETVEAELYKLLD